MQCSSIPAVYHLIQQTDPSQPTKLMILGPACSGAAELMGEIAQRFMNITQVYIYTKLATRLSHDQCIATYIATTPTCENYIQSIHSHTVVR